jgi:hypothetical protein
MNQMKNSFESLEDDLVIKNKRSKATDGSNKK